MTLPRTSSCDGVKLAAHVLCAALIQLCQAQASILVMMLLRACRLPALVPWPAL